MKKYLRLIVPNHNRFYIKTFTMQQTLKKRGPKIFLEAYVNGTACVLVISLVVSIYTPIRKRIGFSDSPSGVAYRK